MSGFWNKSSKLMLESLLVKLEIGSGFGGFFDSNDHGGDDNGNNYDA